MAKATAAPNLARAAAAYDALEQRRTQRQAHATVAPLTADESAELSKSSGRTKSAKAFDTPLNRRAYGLPPDRNTLRCVELAELLSVSPSHIKRLCDAGLIVTKAGPGRKANYKSIPLPAIMAFIRKRRGSSASRLQSPEKKSAKRLQSRCRERAEQPHPGKS